jgi:hypothetical protein
VAQGGKLPLVALNDSAAGEKTPAEWRCYSPTCLDPAKQRYVDPKCKLYCTTPALAGILDNCTDPRPPPIAKVIRVNATDVWGAVRSAGCGEIRTPELVVMATRVLLIGQCRNGNATRQALMDAGGGVDVGDGGGGGGGGSGGSGERASLGDDMREDRIVSIASSDGGRTWDPSSYRVLTPRGRSDAPCTDVTVAVLVAADETIAVLLAADVTTFCLRLTLNVSVHGFALRETHALQSNHADLSREERLTCTTNKQSPTRSCSHATGLWALQCTTPFGRP